MRILRILRARMYNVLAEGKNVSASKLLERLIKDDPLFHSLEGVPTSWAVHPDTLRFLFSLLTPGASTLETGCGQTTVVFSIAGTHHSCIMPDDAEAERVKEYCTKLGLSIDTRFIIESSDKVLPCSELIPSKLDFVFIDGAHAFPAPIIDWHYTARRLRIGGVLAVDDYRMPSVKILYDFLCAEEQWGLIGTVHYTAFFRKQGELRDLSDWPAQKINSTYPGY